jgi:hypothetical protein
MIKRKVLSAVIAAGALLLFGACSAVTDNVLPEDSSSTESGARTVVSGTNGSVDVTNMTGNNLTITYSPGSQKNYARLYVSEGNGTGLVLANADMSYSGGSYSYTASNSTFKSNAKIYFCVLVNDGGTEKCIPQGTLSSTSSWASVTYGASDSSSSDTVASNGITSGATYKIIAKCSGKSLDDDGWSKTNGANVIQWTYGNNQANQQWKITSTGDGYYSIINVYSGLGLDVAEWSTAAGGNIQQWAYASQANQQWKIEKLTDGYYKITNRNSGKVMDVSSSSTSDGANVQQWDWNETNAQRWQLTSLGTSSSDSSTNTDTNTSGTNVSLLGLNSGYEMTFQFQNNTNGKYASSNIYICCVARNSSGNFCYLKPDGTLQPISANTSSESWSYKLSDISGFQIPTTMTSGRMYFSMDKPVVMKGIVDGAGNIGVVQPDLNNVSDANYNTVFDWIEFTVQGGGFWGNTTQVDQFGFPITMAMYNDSGYYRTVGITLTRDEVFSKYKSSVPAEFQTLASDKRIIAPCKGLFRTGRTYGTYMDSYVNEVWNYYANNTLYVDHPLGKFEGRTSGNQFIFTCTNGYGTAVTGQKYYINGKPNNDELFEGSGVLASGNTVELALQAQMCAALNRHIVASPSSWATPSAYYQAAPCNYFAKFWHDVSIDGKAYGFCYDDVADQSSIIETHSPRALVIGIGW